MKSIHSTALYGATFRVTMRGCTDGGTPRPRMTVPGCGRIRLKNEVRTARPRHARVGRGRHPAAEDEAAGLLGALLARRLGGAASAPTATWQGARRQS